MLLAEPPSTQGDLHFRLFGVPVRIHPWFWIVALLLGIDGSGPADPVKTLLWVVIVLASILVHEFGHALVQRYFGGHPRITLYSFGGLAYCDDCDRSPRSQVLISLAGPAAGFVLAACVVAFLAVTGHFVGFHRDWIPVVWKKFDLDYYERFGKLSPRDTVVLMLLWVNIFWGILNLLPIYPLDGGRVARELFTLNQPRRGIIRSLWLSVGTAGVVAAFCGLSLHSFFMALMFGYLAYGSYQTLRAYEQHGY